MSYLKAQDTISGKEGKAVATIDGNGMERHRKYDYLLYYHKLQKANDQLYAKRCRYLFRYTGHK